MNRRPRAPIALLTDFGTRDWYVAAVKGVILSKCPEARLIDITHEVPPQDIVSGAFILAAAAAWFPAGTVFLAVVDPGVGSQRALLAVYADGRYFVGPDNGLLSLSVSRAKALRIIRLTNRRYWLSSVSQTFQGRDVLAPVAAYLAGGGSFTRLGVAAHEMVPLELPAVQKRGRVYLGQVSHIDAFGNLVTNLPGRMAAACLREAGARVILRYKDQKARVVSSYVAGRPNELVAVIGSLGLIELAIREGSAAWAYHAKRGDQVELLPG